MLYIDLIILLIIVAGVLFYFRNFSSFVFIIAITDILLRILTFLKYNLGLNELKTFISKYSSESIFHIIDKYTKGDINIILKWLFIIIMITFLFYIIKIWIKKKKF